MATTLGARVSRAVVFSALNTIFTRVVTVVVVAVVVRLVSPEQFGTYAVALTAYTVIAGFSELGLASILARQDLDPDTIGSTVSALALAISSVMAVSMFLGAGPLARAMGAPAADDPLRALSVSVFLIGVFAVPTGLLTRSFRQGSILVAQLVAAVPDNALCIWLAAEGHGAMAFAWSRVVGHLITGAVLLYLARQFYVPRVRREHLRTVVVFGVGVGGANLVRYVLLNADYLFVGRLLGATALGFYTLAFQVGQWATSVLSTMVNSVAMTALSHAVHDPAGLRASLRNALVLVSLAAFPIAGFVAVLAGPIVRVLYGEKWLAAVPVLEILSVYGSMFILTLLLGNVLVATGRATRLLGLQVFWLAVLVPAMVAGVELDGLRGAATAHIVVLLGIVLPAHVWAIRHLVPGSGRLLLGAAVVPLLYAVAASLVVWLVAGQVDGALPKLLLGGSAGSIVYVVMALSLLRGYLPDGLARTLRHPAYDASFGRLLAPTVRLHRRLCAEEDPAPQV